MATIPTQITIPEPILPLIQDAATEKGQPIETFVGEAISRGESIQGIANDRKFQAQNRLDQKGVIPAEVLAESRRFAEANAPKIAVVSA